MKSTGFLIRRLTVSGPGVPDAVVTFTPGLNVITGASDTGKSYIFECIDYMLGGETPPRAIDESAAYELVALELFRDDESFVLERALRGGAFRLRRADGKETVLGPKHKPKKDDNISAFLLDLCALKGKKVQMDKNAKTRPISFRDVARLILVDEEKIITKGSPVLTGQYVTRTVEGSVFQLMLTGHDASALIAAESSKVRALKSRAQETLLSRLTDELKAELATLASDGEPSLERLAKIDEEISARSQLAAVARSDSCFALFKGSQAVNSGCTSWS